MSSINLSSQISGPLDPGFQPSVLWNRAYREQVVASQSAAPIAVGIGVGETLVARVDTQVKGDDLEGSDTRTYVERLVKSLLWVHGGNRVVIGGAPELATWLQGEYAVDGTRGFDQQLMGDEIYPRNFRVESVGLDAMPELDSAAEESIGRHVKGNRIGFDLGGSDRKAAAVIDGEVVFSEEIEWNPYFEADPKYHFDGIVDSLQRVAKHLPKVDAVGGSAAGVYVDNEVRAASLFRGVPKAVFNERVRRIFFDVMAHMGWGDVPWRVINDGEVTALAGSMSRQANRLLGLSMGTSFAAGYITASGSISRRLNELAFVPVDYRPDGPIDEWSGDCGCGVQYFSQQGVARLAKVAGLQFEEEVGFPERLVEVQRLMAAGDSRAESIYRTIGVCFGYTIAQFSEFYELEHLLILGRVTSGDGGQLILDVAREVLDKEFPELSAAIQFHIPDEKEKRHGQAVAAASLAELRT